MAHPSHILLRCSTRRSSMRRKRWQQADQHELRVQHRLDLWEADPLGVEKPADAARRLLVQLDRLEH